MKLADVSLGDIAGVPVDHLSGAVLLQTGPVGTAGDGHHVDASVGGKLHHIGAHRTGGADHAERGAVAELKLTLDQVERSARRHGSSAASSNPSAAGTSPNEGEASMTVCSA